MASVRRRRWRIGPLVLTVASVAVASGCATVPSGGAPQPLEGQGGQQQAFVQPLPPPAPTTDWTAEDVVQGFLQASANFELDPAAGRQYLAPGVQWKPPGTVIVVSPSGLSLHTLPKITGGNTETVTVSGQELASLSSTGQYEYTPQASSPTLTFVLEQVGGKWLIESLPTGQPLLLTQTNFNLVFQPRNLFFFGQASEATPSAGPNSVARLPAADLVPDPVFAPLQGPATANTTTLATGLVRALLRGPGGWLSGATLTQFPHGTTLLNVTISDVSGNLTALVNLGGSAGALVKPGSQAVVRAQKQTLGLMYAQLYQTLTSKAYSPRVVNTVELAINNKLQRIPARFTAAVVPAVGEGLEPLFYTAGGTVYALDPGPTTIATPGQLASQAGITAIAVSRGQHPQLAAAVRTAGGCSVSVGQIDAKKGYISHVLARTGGPCTSLSWDDGGNLWATAGSRIWVLQPGDAPIQVSLPWPAGLQHLPDKRVLALRIAPDGVRAALLVETGAPTGHSLVKRLLLAAVAQGPDILTLGQTVPVGTDLTDPVAVSWYSPYGLVAVAGSELYQVPLTGGVSTLLGPVDTGAGAITTNGTDVVVGTGNGRILRSVGTSGEWTPVATGSGLAYPG
jgi:Lipoprotein LpqB beta-propeller domain/Sporulation and spore germination